MTDNLIVSNITSPTGDITLVTQGGIIVICEFADHDDRVARQLRQYYSDVAISNGEPPEAIQTVFEAYFAGDLDTLDELETAPMGTAYEQRVWERLRKIPAGTTTHYGAIAQELNSSARAVGRANGRNPIALIHPCHRVIGADGSLTGYAGGLKRKEWLLQHEGALLPL